MNIKNIRIIKNLEEGKFNIINSKAYKKIKNETEVMKELGQNTEPVVLLEKLNLVVDADAYRHYLVYKELEEKYIPHVYLKFNQLNTKQKNLLMCSEYAGVISKVFK